VLRDGGEMVEERKKSKGDVVAGWSFCGGGGGGGVSFFALGRGGKRFSRCSDGCQIWLAGCQHDGAVPYPPCSLGLSCRCAGTGYAGGRHSPRPSEHAG